MGKQEYTYDEAKELAKRAFIKGWLKRVGSDNPSEITKKTAESRFEQWWSVNVEK